MLVMDIHFQQMLPMFSRIGSDRLIYRLDKGTHWVFYMDTSDNVVLRARVDKVGGQEDALFMATTPGERVIAVHSVVWGKGNAVTSIVQEIREEIGEPRSQIHPAEPLGDEVAAYRGDDDKADHPIDEEAEE